MRYLSLEGRPPWVGRLLRWLEGLERVILKLHRALLGTLILAAIAINFSNVVGRYFFGTSLGWTEEVLSYLLIWSVFVGSVLVTLDNQHLRVNAIEAYLPPWGRHLLEALMLLCMIALCLFVARQSSAVVSLMSQMGQRSSTAGIPMAWAHAGVYVGFAMMAVAAGLRLARHLLEGVARDHDAKESSS